MLYAHRAAAYNTALVGALTAKNSVKTETMGLNEPDAST